LSRLPGKRKTGPRLAREPGRKHNQHDRFKPTRDRTQ
jgi:hypothetical protein